MSELFPPFQFGLEFTRLNFRFVSLRRRPPEPPVEQEEQGRLPRPGSEVRRLVVRRQPRRRALRLLGGKDEGKKNTKKE